VVWLKWDVSGPKILDFLFSGSVTNTTTCHHSYIYSKALDIITETHKVKISKVLGRQTCFSTVFTHHSISPALPHPSSQPSAGEIMASDEIGPPRPPDVDGKRIIIGVDFGLTCMGMYAEVASERDAEG
jgi:hypothetical protein